eukprot:5136567-Amphidinium_carterae.1
MLQSPIFPVHNDSQTNNRQKTGNMIAFVNKTHTESRIVPKSCTGNSSEDMRSASAHKLPNSQPDSVRISIPIHPCSSCPESEKSAKEQQAKGTTLPSGTNH